MALSGIVSEMLYAKNGQYLTSIDQRSLGSLSVLGQIWHW